MGGCKNCCERKCKKRVPCPCLPKATDCRSFADVVAPRCDCTCVPRAGCCPQNNNNAAGGCCPQNNNDNNDCGATRPCACGPLQVIACDIACSRTLCGLILIDAEVHVLSGARLTITPGSTVYFRNGPLTDVDDGSLPFASLVIDSGASLRAKDVEFKNQVDVPNNTGGVIIVGTNAPTIGLFGDVYEASLYDSVIADPAAASKKSKLENVRFTNLGNNAARLNPLTLFQTLGDAEVSLKSYYSVNSGNDGLSIFGGTFTLNYVNVSNALGDALQVDYNGTVTITEELSIVTAPERAAVNVAGASGSLNRIAVNETAYITIAAAHFADTPDSPVNTYSTGGSFPAPANITDPVTISEMAQPNTHVQASNL